MAGLFAFDQTVKSCSNAPFVSFACDALVMIWEKQVQNNVLQLWWSTKFLAVLFRKFFEDLADCNMVF
ncbi:hypothetical protein ASF28_09995 [Methylobacterium sp. Leaf99]|nr:hypothetical protein ASF28_09995 [Methylobacterium sp. Leaf99]